MIEVLNEPDFTAPQTLYESFYPAAYAAIRATEVELGIPPAAWLHVQLMSEQWAGYNPLGSLNDTFYCANDYHRYLKYDPSVTQTQAGYLSTSCNDKIATYDGVPNIVSEWSISVASDVEDNADFEVIDTNNDGFYKKWFAAQAQTYEREADGWVYWAWKSELGEDYRWSYQQAVQRGIIPTNLNDLSQVGACS
jgi:hypothetical protein